MPDQLVTYDLQDRVALIGLNRPEKCNAMSTALLDGIDEAALRASREAAAAVIYGHGPNFCSGVDLVELRERRPHGDPNARWRNPSFIKIAQGEIPFIAALRGAVIGGGLELAAACQIRVADQTSFFSLPEARRGIFLGGGGAVRLARLMSVARMQDMMLTGRVVSAREAEEWNLVQYVVDTGQDFAFALDIALQVSKNSWRTNFAVVNGLPRIAGAQPDDGLFMERLVGAWTVGPDTQDRLHRFKEDRVRRSRPPASA